MASTITGLYIFRRDLRIKHNLAIYNALSECDKVLPIFIFTPEQIKKNPYKSEHAIQFMIESLDDLKNDLQDKNGDLFTFYGDYEDIIKNLIKGNNIQNVYVNRDYTPYSKKRDNEIKKLCDSLNVTFKSYNDVCLFEPQTITTENGMYKKFTPFYNECLKKIKSIDFVPSYSFKKGWCEKIENNKYSISLKDAYIKYITPNKNNLIQGGREFAIKILNDIKEFKDYGKTRNLIYIPTTQLSGYLKFGCISSKEMYKVLIEKGFSKSHDLIRQLVWRDFYIHILDAYPHVLKGKSFKPQYDMIKWENDTKLFNAWKEGKTGFPIVDACMRQLNTVGYMHNRGRLIVASFLIKTLFIDWRKGEKYFAQQLIDYDPAANNGNWQWVAGSGVDSQPYFRIFNPWSQSEKHDKDAIYIKQWCPELTDVPAKDIHNWFKTYDDYLKNGIHYIKPIVDYSERRKMVLDKYKKYL